ncbi:MULTISPECIES: DoxX family protein [Pseudomonas]|uniref:DoxX family protein n=1 Tax=Pseudomonas TaxID=286 RepID=UPI0015A440C4|nr:MULTISPECIES: DoxX family protein [Pseudomonas]NVZ62983.1 DoxX family protein [Pseudomonas gingeri]NVZ77433.1 DoxX family protein [Pseudomonas gingeri]NWA09490.1 DoxX family protein [Pseudomonas gingeri]NWE49579.1 DoxX family protein [Pseudomonas gingeri]NWE68812.1 DoxX family protein [Pseudomonas gingeri]
MSQGTLSQNTTAHSALGSLSDNTSASAGVALAGRILLSVIFLLSGFSKVADPSAMLGYIGSAGLPFPQLALIVAIAVEIGGSLLLILGYRTRLVALVMAVFTLATALAFHNHLADQNQFIHFFKNIAMTGGLLQVVAFGAGRFSLDARRRG